MPGIMGRKSRRRVNRKKNSAANRPQPTAPIGITNATKAANVATVSFNQPVALSGIPNYTTDLAGPKVAAAEMTDPMTLQLTFDAAIGTATQLRVPYEEPSIRNASGGFVANSAVLFAA